MKLLKIHLLCLITFSMHPSNTQHDVKHASSYVKISKSKSKCVALGCNKKRYGKRFCKRHYQQFIIKPQLPLKIKKLLLKTENICFMCLKTTKGKTLCSQCIQRKPFNPMKHQRFCISK